MDYSRRQRYHARRKALAARRRLTAALTLAVVCLAALAGWLVWPRPVASPSAEPAPQPSAASVAGSVMPTEQVARRSPNFAGPARFFHDQRLSYEPNYYIPEVQSFLDSQSGVLKQFSAPIGDRRHTFAEIVVGQSLYYSLNPKVVLALLESQSGLLSNSAPSQAQQDWALGYHTLDKKPEEDKLKGLTAQIRWAVRQLLYARRDYAVYSPLSFADGTTQPAPAGWELGQYALARAIAPATTPDKLEARMQAFFAMYTRLFGDPRLVPEGWPAPAAPFLQSPLPHPARVTSFFDHDGPFLSRNGGTFSYWGRNETDLSYDGHDGWDYALAPPDPALAAADGTVIFAGNADDNCATTAVVLDHGNGYRTLYWHLSDVSVQIGQRVAAGEAVGITGASGCAFGPHLHFGVQYLGRNTDPYGYCGVTPDPWAANPSGIVDAWLWVDRPSPCGSSPSGTVVVDSDSPGFTKTGAWQQSSLGYGGGALFAKSVGASEPTAQGAGTPHATAGTEETTPTATATYRPTLPSAGRYRLLAYVPYVINGLDDAIGVTYRVRHDGGEAQITVDMQQYANEYIDLGTYFFSPGSAEVSLDNRASAADQSVWADALLWEAQ